MDSVFGFFHMVLFYFIDLFYFVRKGILAGDLVTYGFIFALASIIIYAVYLIKHPNSGNTNSSDSNTGNHLFNEDSFPMNDPTDLDPGNPFSNND